MTASQPQRIFRAVFSSAVLSAGLGCGQAAAPPAAANADRTLLVAQPCAALRPAPGPIDAANARVFVEVVDVITRDLPQPLGRWLDDNVVLVRSTINLVAFPDVPTSMPWGQCVDAVCTSTQPSITLTARLPKLTTEPFTLRVRIEEPAAEGSAASPRALLDSTLAVPGQEPVVLPPAPELSAGSLIVTAYLLQGPHDLHRVLECKARQGEPKTAIVH